MTANVLKAGALLGCLAAACASQVVTEGPSPGVRVRDARAPNAGLALNSVRIIDPDLQSQSRTGMLSSRVAVEANNSRRTPNGTLEVWATLRNRTEYPMSLEARVQFFDREEAPAEKATAWKRLHLPSNGIANYQEYSSGTTAVAYYYVEVREAR